MLQQSPQFLTTGVIREQIAYQPCKLYVYQKAEDITHVYCQVESKRLDYASFFLYDWNVDGPCFVLSLSEYF